MDKPDELSLDWARFLLVEAWLRGESFTAKDISRRYNLNQSQTYKIIDQCRTILLEEYNAVLPIAHYHGEFRLTITTDAVTAYYGEQPQIRGLQTRIHKSAVRLGGAVMLEKENPKMARNVLGQINDSATHMERSLDSVDIFMEMAKERKQSA